MPEIDRDLTALHQRLCAARTPAEIFGPAIGPDPAGQAALKASYRRLCKIAHPDRYTSAADRQLAGEVFARLTDCLTAAQQPLPPAAPAITGTILVHGQEYRLGRPLGDGDLCHLIHCTTHDGQSALLKLAIAPEDSDLVANEAASLTQLAASSALAGYTAYVPRLLATFDCADPDTGACRRANVLPYYADFISLRALRRRFPDGLPVEHMGWIWRRLLTALAVTHRAGLIHGAVLPDHILIHPLDRGLVLIDWSYAVPLNSGLPITAVSIAYERWYPAELGRREPPTTGTDLFLAARCMVDLLGGDPLTGRLPTIVPPRIAAFLAGTARQRLAQRPVCAAELLAEFDELLSHLYGPRRYQPLVIPA